MAPENLHHLKTLLSAEEIIEPSSPLYAAASSVWAAQKHLHPKLVVAPKDIASLSKIIAYLATTKLDFDVRSHGYGNASARDVLVSLAAFDQFHFDSANKVVTLGPGQTWGDYYGKMEKVAPDFSVVACRTPFIGVGGSILCGGFSWLTAEYGLTSDPRNLLDAQVVKLDGTVIWASEEPDLMWALRGAGGSFGVVTAFKLRAYRYPTSIFSGTIMLPKNSLPEVAKAVATFARRPLDTKVNMFLYVLKKELLHLIGATQDMIIVHAFDAHGEEHGRGDGGFGWALKLPGVIDNTKVMNIKGIADMQAHFAQAKGLMNSYWAPVALHGVTEDIILRSFEWFDDVQNAKGTISDSGYLLYELFQMPAYGKSLEVPDGAWPRRQGVKHVMLLGAGCHPSASAEEDATAQGLVKEGPSRICGEQEDINFVPNTIEEFHARKQVFGDHYEKLLRLKKVYDPENRLKGPIAVA